MTINTNAERWAPIRTWEGLYEVSDHGRVKALARTARNRYGEYQRRERVLSPVTIKGGYQVASFFYKGAERRESRLVHHLVLEAFVGPAPGPIGTGRHDWQGNHINGDTGDNHVGNLEWLTGLQNARHAARTGLRPRGVRVNTAKLNPEKVRAIRRAAARPGSNYAALGREYGVSGANVSAIVRRHTWKHVQ